MNHASRRAGIPFSNTLLIDHGWLYSQAILIRSAAFDRQRDACSIRSAISFLRRNCGHVTRRAYVTEGDIPYDFERARNAYLDALPTFQHDNADLQARPMSPEGQRWVLSQLRHSRFDEISLTAPEERRPTDRLSEDWLNTVEDPVTRLEAPLKDFVNHFIAHSIRSDVSSSLDAEAQRTSIAQVEQAWGIIMGVNRRLCDMLLDGGVRRHMPFQPEDFALLEGPIIPSAHINEMKRFYKELNRRLPRLDEEGDGTASGTSLA